MVHNTTCSSLFLTLDLQGKRWVSLISSTRRPVTNQSMRYTRFFYSFFNKKCISSFSFSYFIFFWNNLAIGY
jgi:hypothetical protein